MKVEFLRLSEVAEVNPRRGALVVDDDLPVSFVPMEAVDDVLGRITAATEKTFSEVKKGYTAFVDHDVIFAKVSPCMQNGKHAVATGLRNGLGFGSTEFHVVRGCCLRGYTISFEPRIRWMQQKRHSMARSVFSEFRLPSLKILCCRCRVLMIKSRLLRT